VPGDASSSPSADAQGSGADAGIPAASDAPVILTVSLKGAGGEAVKVHLSDGSSFVLHAEVYARAGLAKDSPLPPDTLSVLLARSERIFARRRALALVARAAQTRRGLARKLAARGYSAPAVRHAIARMEALGYLDDRAFAEAWLRSRLSSSPQGWRALSRGLQGRGVPRAVAEEVLAAEMPPEVEKEQAMKVAANLSPEAAVRKLSLRGFRTPVISAVLRELRRKATSPGAD
jgi:regulatory protein